MKDLAMLDTLTGSEDGRWIEPVDMEGQKIGLRIKVRGPDSKKYNQLRDDVQREAYRSLTQASNGLEVKPIEKSEAEREAEFYARMTLDWQPIDPADPVTWEGQPLVFSEGEAAKLYLKAAVIRNQVRMFVESRRNFTPPAPAGLEKQ